MSSLQTMTYEVGDRIARLTLNRPERGNGLTRRCWASSSAASSAPISIPTCT